MLRIFLSSKKCLGLVGLRARVLTITYVNHKHVCFSSHELNAFFGLMKLTTHPRSGDYIEDYIG